MLAGDDNLIALAHVLLDGAGEVLDEHRRAAPKHDLVDALRVEELLRCLRSRRDPGRALLRDDVVGTQLNVRVEQIVRDARDRIAEALRATGVVCVEEAGREGWEGATYGGDVEGRHWGSWCVAR